MIILQPDLCSRQRLRRRDASRCRTSLRDRFQIRRIRRIRRSGARSAVNAQNLIDGRTQLVADTRADDHLQAVLFNHAQHTVHLSDGLFVHLGQVFVLDADTGRALFDRYKIFLTAGKLDQRLCRR